MVVVSGVVDVSDVVVPPPTVSGVGDGMFSIVFSLIKYYQLSDVGATLCS